MGKATQAFPFSPPRFCLGASELPTCSQPASSAGPDRHHTYAKWAPRHHNFPPCQAAEEIVPPKHATPFPTPWASPLLNRGFRPSWRAAIAGGRAPFSYAEGGRCHFSSQGWGKKSCLETTAIHCWAVSISSECTDNAELAGLELNSEPLAGSGLGSSVGSVGQLLAFALLPLLGQALISWGHSKTLPGQAGASHGGGAAALDSRPARQQLARRGERWRPREASHHIQTPRTCVKPVQAFGDQKAGVKPDANEHRRSQLSGRQLATVTAIQLSN